MKEPIFAYEPIDLTVFRTLADAELYLEAPEIDDNSLIFFDAEGRTLRARVGNHNARERIVITDGADGMNPAFLRQLIIDFLQNLGYVRSDIEQNELSDLVRECLRFTTK